MQLVILSGLSGSGKSIALRTLEDLGYYCIDNLPLFLVKDMVLSLRERAGDTFQRTAIGVDARSSIDEVNQIPRLIRIARKRGVACQLIFLEADTETLIRRFSETRRRHPLTGTERSLHEAIRDERTLLKPVRDSADLRIDTTHTNLHELRERIRGWLVGSASPKASIVLQSFGFKHGVPAAVDFVFDVRCLPNPHWQASLKDHNGRDAPVAEFLEQHTEVVEMRQDIIEFFDRWIPRFENDGRSYLTIAVGCTGGQHRSVYMIEQLRTHFERQGHEVMVRHRELI